MDSLKYFEISEPRHVRFAELRKQSIEQPHFTNEYVIWLRKLTDVLNILGKRGEIATKEQFLLFSTIFYYLLLYFHVKTGTRLPLWDERLFEISEVFWHMSPTKTQIGRRFRAVWSVFVVHMKTICILGYPKYASEAGECAGWSEFSLDACVRKYVFWRWGLYIDLLWPKLIFLTEESVTCNNLRNIEK